MINEEKVLAIVPARSGSVGIKNKNIRSFGGKPLMQWTVDCAKEIKTIDKIVVSSNGEEILDVAKDFDVSLHHRSDKLGNSESLIIDTIRNIIAEYKSVDEVYPIVLLLEPTSPFRVPQDITDCLDLLLKNNLDSVATFTDAFLNPIRAWKIENDIPQPYLKNQDNWARRQDLTPAYELNGAVYAFRAEKLPSKDSNLLFGKTGAVMMPQSRSLQLDTESEFEIAEYIFNMRKNEKTK